MKRLVEIFLVIFVSTVLASTGYGQALIGPGDFGPGAVVESFEGLAVGSNIPAVRNGAFLQPGFSQPYTFQSGISITAPIPNFEEEGPLIGDFALGDARFEMFFDSVKNPGDVPFGTAYMVCGCDFAPGYLQLTFPAGSMRVGAYIGGSNESVSFAIYDENGELLDSYTVSTEDSGQWSTRFVGFENTTAIHTMTIQGISSMSLGDNSTPQPQPTLVAGPTFFLLDGVTYEVPEPATIIILGLGSGLLFSKRKTRHLLKN